jgi:hypothetical protein
MKFFGLRRRDAGSGASGALTEADVALVYRILLGRAPSSRETDAGLAAGSPEDLRDRLLETQEVQRFLIPAEANADTKPLLLVGFPRGFTSQSYDILGRVTGLKEHYPNAGEFLNLQRLRATFPFAVQNRMKFYDTSDDLYELVAEAMLRVKPGSIVKDVVQPFHVLRFLQENPSRFNVVYVKRNLSHVAFSLLRREWGYVHQLQQLHERFSRFAAIDVDRTLEDITYPVEVARSLGYAARGYDYRDSDFLKQKREFEEDFARDSGQFDLSGFIENTDRKKVVDRFGREAVRSRAAVR